MNDSIRGRLALLAADGNLDVEDIDEALALALEDGRLDAAEAAELRAALDTWRLQLEPAARRYLEDRLSGRAQALVNRVLLAPHPRAQPRDLYYSRAEVTGLQERLNALGHPCTVDGDYGPGTARAVASLQRALGLPASGVVDSRTLARLNAALRKLGRPALDLNPRARIRPDHVIAVRGAGDRAQVAALQAGLNALSTHYGLGLAALTTDGAFGARTEAALQAVQAALYLPQTGIFDLSTAQAMNTALRAAGRPTVPEQAPATGGHHGGRVELHFYPNPAELKLYVLRGGQLLDTYGMVGGEPTARPSPDNPKVNRDPTPAGRYQVVSAGPHTSSVWPRSYVPYGAPLRELGGEVQYRGDDGQWRWATGPASVFKDRDPPALLAQHYKNPDGTLPPFYTQNDFGHLRVLLRDARTGAQQTHMIHPIPSLEDADYWADTAGLEFPTAALATLRFSHGCEHIHPRDLDELVARGYLAPGTVFVVHGYDERYGM